MKLALVSAFFIVFALAVLVAALLALVLVLRELVADTVLLVRVLSAALLATKSCHELLRG